MEQKQLRREKRTTLRQAVQYRVLFRSEMLDFETQGGVVGEVTDISSGGLFIKCEFFEAPGTPVSLLVWLPDQAEPVALRGHVAWIAEHPPKGPGMGIKLTQ